MPLSILARLRDGRYDAAGGRADTAEWPPHPARLFCALVASATGEGDWGALRWLEAAGPPEVWASRQFESVRRDGYVVTNVTSGKGGSQHRLGRTNGMRTRFSAEPDDPEFVFVWPDASPADAEMRALITLARRVPYLGRSTSPVTLRVGAELAEPRTRWTRFVPSRLGSASAVSLRVPYDGYTERLREAYAAGRRSWEVDRAIPYATPDVEPQPASAAVRSPFSELLIFGVARGTVKPAGGSLLTVTSRLREAVMSRIGDEVPAQVSGHGAPDRRHLAYVALPHVGHRHADGRLLGVAIAVPEDLDRRAYARLWSAVIDPPLEKLTVRRDLVLPVEYLPAASTPWGVNAERWTAEGRGGSRRWVTATPMMLDHYVKRSRGHDEMIKKVGESLVRAGYPEPADWSFSPAPMIDGGLHQLRRDTMPPNRPYRPMVHVRVEFAEPVIGPVIAGSMRYLGLGLFVPDKEAP